MSDEIVNFKIITSAADGGYISASDVSETSDFSDFEDEEQTYTARCSCCGKAISKPILNPVGPDDAKYLLEWCPGFSNCLLTILKINTFVEKIINYKNPFDVIDIIGKQKRLYNNISEISEDDNHREISSTLFYIISLEKNKYFSGITKDSLVMKIITTWFIGNKSRIYNLASFLQDINDRKF